MSVPKLEFVTFSSIEDGESFIARGKLHCKGTIGILRKPDTGSRTDYNAFYYENHVGVWAHFGDLVLVQKYNPEIHNKTDSIIKFFESSNV